MATRSLRALIVTVVIALLGSQLAYAVPPTPYGTYGTVKIDDENVPEGTVIKAYCDDDPTAYGTTTTIFFNGVSVYQIDVLGDDPESPGVDGCVSGQTVSYTIDNLPAKETTIWVSGAIEELNLTAEIPAPAVSLEKLTNGQDAGAAPGPYVAAGQPITWTYVISNTGNVALTAVEVIDDNGTPGVSGDDFTVCTLANLARYGSHTCEIHDAAQPGQYGNSATVTAVYTNTVSGFDTSHYFGVVTSLDLEKSTNGRDADSAPGPYVLAGQPITWTFTLTNTGNISLTNVVISDTVLGTICTVTTLVPGDPPVNCSVFGTAAPGQYSNTGLATGTPIVEGFADVSDSDLSHYFGSQPAVTMEKSTNDQDADTAPGPYILVSNPVTWTYTVSNDGNVDLSNLQVTDNREVSISCPPDLLANLPSGQSMECTATGTAVAGQYANLGSVIGSAPEGVAQVSSDDPSHYYGANPSIDLEKHTNDQDADSGTGPYILVGQPVTWTYIVVNTGNVDLSNVVVTDDQLGPICTIPSLAVGANPITCTANGTAVAGQYSNSATATGSPPGGLLDVSDTDPSHYFGATPSITLEKTTNNQDADSGTGPIIPVGDPVTWRYTVDNTGNVTLTGITVTDDILGAVCTIPSLTPAAAPVTCTKNGTAAAGQYTNLGSVTGSPPGGLDPVGDDDPSHYFGAAPAISLEKTTNGQGADTGTGPFILVGDPVNWAFTVDNTGNISLTNVTVTDNQLGLICEIANLAPGDPPAVCNANGTATTGQYANLGTVEGDPLGGLPAVSDTDPSHYFGASPAVSIEKTTNGQDADSGTGPYILAGQPVEWVYTVVNTGNVDLTGVVVTDDVLGAVCTIGSLPEGAPPAVCTENGTAQPGQYANEGRVEGTYANVVVSDTDPSHYYGAITTLHLEKTTNNQDADSGAGPIIPVGDPVTWRYTVDNTGNVTLTGITVTDDKLGAVCTIPSLTPAAAPVTCTKNGLAAAGQYSNLGTAQGTPPGGLPAVLDEDPSHYFGAAPSIDIEKFTNGQDADLGTGPYILVGDPVTWTFTITNTGNISLTSVTINDDILGLVCTVSNMAPGDAPATCTVNGTAVQGQYANLGSVEAFPLGGLDPVSDVDPSHYFGANPGVSIQKLTNDQDADTGTGPYIRVGDTVTWTYVIANTGNVDLANLVVTDDNGTPANPQDDFISCEIGSLGAGGQQSCDQTGQAEVGQYRNLGAVRGQALVVDLEVADQNSSAYFGTNPSLEIKKFTNDLDADSPPGPRLEAGKPVTWTYVFTYSGNVTLTDVSVIDDMGTPDEPGDDVVACQYPAIAPQDTPLTCTYVGLVTPGQYANTGRVEGLSPDGGLVIATDISHYFGFEAVPSIQLLLRTNQKLSGTPPGPEILAGETITWSYTLFNVGNVDLDTITLTDNNGTPFNPGDDIEVCAFALLAQGESQVCLLNGLSAAGPYAHTGTVISFRDGAVISDTVNGYYFGANPGLGLEKATNGQDADSPPGPTIVTGQAVTWTYQVTNAGNVDLLGVKVIDDHQGQVCTISTLVAGGQTGCQSNALAGIGAYQNLGTAQVIYADDVGNTVPVTAGDASHYFGANPIIDLEKSTNGQDADQEPGPVILAGDPVTWTYTVANLGNVDLLDIVVNDDQLGQVCQIDQLAFGAQPVTCEMVSTAGVGPYANTATAQATIIDQLTSVEDSDPSHYYGAAPAVDLEKSTNGQDADEGPGPMIPIGQPITWTYTVSNTGNIILNEVRVLDDQLGLVCEIGDLPVGGPPAVCTANGTAGLGSYVNLGAVEATAVSGQASVSDSDSSHYFGVNAAISLEKLTNDQDADTAPGPILLAGDPVTWQFIVDNIGNVEISGIVVTDDQLGQVCVVGDLAPNDQFVCPPVQGQAAPGQYANTGRAEGDFGGLPVWDTDQSHYFGVDPAISLEKRIEGFTADQPPGPSILAGASLTWTFTISNTGNYTLTDIVVREEPGGAIVCQVPELGAGVDPVTCTKPGAAMSGQQSNTASVEGTVLGGLAVAGDSDSATYFGAQPALTLDKKTNGQDATQPPGPEIQTGDPVTWTYTIANSGNVDLLQVEVVDDQQGAVCTVALLPAGDSDECELVDVAVFGQYGNEGTASVTYHDDVGNSQALEVTDASHYFGAGPGIKLMKYTNGKDVAEEPGPTIFPGRPVVWTYVVTNIGNTTLLNVQVADSDEGVNPSCPKTSLAPGEEMTCTATGVAVEGQYMNLATASGSSPAGREVSAGDVSFYLGRILRLFMPSLMRAR